MRRPLLSLLLLLAAPLAAVEKYTVSTAPSCGATDFFIYSVSDALVDVDCGTAGGSAKVTCVCSGGTRYSLTTTKHGAQVYHNTTQSRSSSAAESVVLFDSEVEDTDAYHSTVTNTGRITIPNASLAGPYTATCVALYANNTTGNRFVVLKRYNSSNVLQEAFAGTLNTATQGAAVTMIEATWRFPNVASGDYLQCESYQNSGGNLNLNQYTTFEAYLSK